MLILSIDSCGSACGVCVWRDGAVLAHSMEKMTRGQDARLMPMIVDVMQRAGVGFDALDRVAVTRGPGSFTGLRVGLAAARGIGLAAKKSVIGIDRFAAYRVLHKDGDPLIVIDSRRAELFCRFFPARGAAQEPCLMTKEQIDAFLVAHPGTVMAGDVDTPDMDITETVAALAATADANDPAFAPRPLYLRAPDVTLPKDLSAR
ncbi:MAG: tRNA (adenosine(37)-N6)-threonylcarbamoyltransferase complex dimerization subunit type 1 TsaB [Alphaproteobacteria bacterium]|nr:tRNA (adenosine(37)-N6)-threonylcarbamoyltransferase complex dimerization subunit type 1 TsaB [Alphaproteobacteria bacterium]